MGVIMKNKVNYTGGGGSGGASALADLEDVELTTPTDGQALVYDAENDLWINGGVVGSGGGSAKYTEKELWSGTLKTVNATASLSESIYNFDQIKILWTPYNGTNNIYHSFTTIPVSDVIINQIAQFLIAVDYANAQYTAYISCCFSDSYTLKINEVGNGTYTDIRILKIIGIKWETMQTALIYSEEEREVGVWTDGKPLYQKTINFGALPSTGTRNYSHNISDVDKIWIKDGFAMHPNGTFIPLNWARPESGNSDEVGCDVTRTNIVIRVGYDRSSFNGYITLCYTKTTDQPGSGIWTTTGEYAHHYSTTEHVIGTWIDGKPIYEKCIDGGTLPNNTSKSIAHGISNLNDVIECKGWARSGSDRHVIPIVNSASAGYQVGFYINDTNIIVADSYNYSSYTTSYFIIRYTKSS